MGIRALVSGTRTKFWTTTSPSASIPLLFVSASLYVGLCHGDMATSSPALQLQESASFSQHLHGNPREGLSRLWLGCLPTSWTIIVARKIEKQNWAGLELVASGWGSLCTVNCGSTRNTWKREGMFTNRREAETKTADVLPWKALA